MSTEKKTAKPDRPSFQGLLLATIVSAIGTCAMAGSLFLQNFARRFPASGAFSGNFNVTRTFNATRPFNMQIAAQRIPTGFGY